MKLSEIGVWYRIEKMRMKVILPEVRATRPPDIPVYIDVNRDELLIVYHIMTDIGNLNGVTYVRSNREPHFSTYGDIHWDYSVT